MIELGSYVTDEATGLDGMVVNLQIEMDLSEFYYFQPRGLNPKSLQPTEGMWLVEKRLSGGKRIASPDLPTHVLGTLVEDDASGFKGIAVSMVYHINGCVHFNVQAKGLQDTGAPIQTCNFDIRRLKGRLILPMTKEEQKKDEVKNPSPAGNSSYKPATQNSVSR
jgi:hypothetical protein